MATTPSKPSVLTFPVSGASVDLVIRVGADGRRLAVLDDGAVEVSFTAMDLPALISAAGAAWEIVERESKAGKP